MNLNFSDERLQRRDQARRSAADCRLAPVTRRGLDTDERLACDPWRAVCKTIIAERGWNLPENPRADKRPPFREIPTGGRR